jgi:2-dehydro-3-deoxyglucarate aldolase/4-hydroxy-2-oxoheptanedioate aldolase
MKINTVKQALVEGRVQLGTGFAQLRSPEVARILAAAGFHWAFIDTEHGAFDIETVQDVCRAAADSGMCPIVRVANMEYDLVARALDCGAMGIIFPRVESVELLQQAVSWTKFPPEGIRGFGLTPTHVNYERATIPEILAHINTNTLVILQIETQKAVDMRDELLSVRGLDAVMVGPVDLSISLGVAGDFQHPKMVQAMEAIRDSCLRRGIAPGTQTRSLALAKFWKERGMRFLGCGSETGMLFEKASELVSSLSAAPASAAA